MVLQGGKADTGRVASLSWPATRRDALVALVGAKAAPPAPGAFACWKKAAYSLAAPRTLVRPVDAAGKRMEIVGETIEHDAAGQLIGRRETVGTIVFGEEEEWPPSLWCYQAPFLRAFEEAQEVLDAGVVGTWCDHYVRERFKATALSTRGHIVHVLAAMAPAFDAFVAGMREATGGTPFVACTVDSDPITLLSLAESLRAGTRGVIEEEKERAIEAKTERGVAGVRARLAEQVDHLSRYRSLLGDTVAELEGEIHTAEEGLAIAAFKQAFPYQAGTTGGG